MQYKKYGMDIILKQTNKQYYAQDIFHILGRCNNYKCAIILQNLKMHKAETDRNKRENTIGIRKSKAIEQLYFNTLSIKIHQTLMQLPCTYPNWHFKTAQQ